VALAVITALLLSIAGRLATARNSIFRQNVSRVTVQQWVKPESGWLYVADSNGMRDSSEVLVVNPGTRAVMSAIQTGYAPDMALSPDGQHLYVASGAPGIISVVDTSTGTVVQQFAAGDRLVQILSSAIPIMSTSPSGRWLAVMQMSGATPDATTYSVATFDTLNNNILAGQANVEGCGIGRLSWVSDSKAFVQCPLINNVSVLTLNGAGQPSAGPLVQLSEATRPSVGPLPIHVGRAAHVMFLSDGENAVVFSPFGAVFQLNLVTQKVLPKVEPRADSWIPLRAWPHTSDGRKVYIGTGAGLIASRTSGEANEIDVFDTQAWQFTGTYKTSVPFWSLTLSKDNRYLYAVSTSARKLLIFDTSTNKEVGTIANVGSMPGLAIAAP
jgi:YVTN family beta-propeller protein